MKEIVILHNDSVCTQLLRRLARDGWDAKIGKHFSIFGRELNEIEDVY